MQSQNQFSQSAQKGNIDQLSPANVLTCKVDAAQVTPLVAGQFVSLADTVGKQFNVIATANATVKSFGVVLRNLKDAEFSAEESCEVAVNGSIVYMEASAAIARGAKVTYAASQKVATAVSTNVVMGIAMDKAAADGDLIRVMVAPAVTTEVVA